MRELFVGIKGWSLSDLMDLKLLSWNVKGLRNRDKRISISKGLSGVYPDILVVQETIIESMSDQIMKEVWGKSLKHWLGVLGGILMIHVVGAFSILSRCKMVDGLEEWIFSGVYGPVIAGEVDEFLGELDDVKARWDLPWCIGEDFNLVQFTHKQKGDVDRDFRMNKFGNFIDR